MRLLVPLLGGLVAVLAAAAVAVSATPAACQGLAVRAKASRRTVAAGAPVRVTVTVKNTGPDPVQGMGVRVTSAVAADWKAKTGKVVPRIEAASVDWLAQQVGPGKTRQFRLQGRTCSGLTPGLQTLVDAAVYHLNATGGVACMTSAPRVMVSTARLCIRV
jgi:uncharacterized repeat protein (TIGR01451 family)